MYDIVFKIGSYGTPFHAKVSAQELTALSAVLMRSVAVRDRYTGKYELLPDSDENASTVTVVKANMVVPPPPPIAQTDDSTTTSSEI